MKTRPMLTLDDCRKITAAAEAEARKNNWNVVIAVDGEQLTRLRSVATRGWGAGPRRDRRPVGTPA